MNINIALIDDHTLFRSGIKALLSRQTEFNIVGEASDGFSGVKLVEQSPMWCCLISICRK